MGFSLLLTTHALRRRKNVDLISFCHKIIEKYKLLLFTSLGHAHICRGSFAGTSAFVCKKGNADHHEIKTINTQDFGFLISVEYLKP